MIEFFEALILKFGFFVVQLIFDKTKSCFEPRIAATQRDFRLDLNMPCEIHGGEQDIT